MFMQFSKKQKLFLFIGLAIILLCGIPLFIAIFLGKKMKNQLLKEFDEFKESPLAKLLKNQLKDNNDFGFTNIKYDGSNLIGFCYSCKEITNFLTLLKLFAIINNENDANVNEDLIADVLKNCSDIIPTTNFVLLPYVFSVDKFKIFKDKYTPGFLVRLGLFITRNSSEINFVHKISALSKELASDIEIFGYLNADICNKSIKLTLNGDAIKDGIINDRNLFVKSTNISVNHKDPKDFFVFILHKANSFDKNDIYGSFLKNVLPDYILRQKIQMILDLIVYHTDKLNDIFPFVSTQIEEIQKRLNEISLRLENDSSLNWVQNEIKINMFWLLGTLVFIFIKEKDVILESLNDTSAFLNVLKKLLSTRFEYSVIFKKLEEIEQKNTLLIDKSFLLIKEFLSEFYQSYFDKKWGTLDESNLHEIVKYSLNRTLELAKNEDFSKFLVECILVFNQNSNDPDPLKKRMMTVLINEGLLCLSRLLVIFID